MTHQTEDLETFLGRAVNDLGAAMSAALCSIGERLGFYRILQSDGPCSAKELAAKAKTNERQTREWLLNQAASHYIEYDPSMERFSLSEPQALAFANPDSPLYMHGAFDIVSSVFFDMEKIEQSYRSGKGLGWGEHHQCLFSGTERFFRPNYVANLVSAWIPALSGMQEKLTRGAKVADIGCGFGASTLIMAQAFPKSEFIGMDYHAPSIDACAERARKAGLKNVSFVTADATSFPGDGFDLITCFDCLHDMGDPKGASARIFNALKPDGLWMIVEPFAADSPSGNMHPLGRMFYAASASICVPASLHTGGPALGAQAGEARLSEVIREGGFSKVRRAAETPFNIVLEASKG